MPARSAESQAPVASITHFMDRDGQFLASVSPRRLFRFECRNCHSASMDITRQSPRASVAHKRFPFTGEKTGIDCRKSIARHLPDRRGIPGRE